MDHPQQSKSKFSCSTCRLWLSSLEEQRKHFQSELHSFNLRRKVVGMIPVSQEDFDSKRVQPDEAKDESESEEVVLFGCNVCRKKFKSPEMQTQHFQSNKHKKAANGKSDAECATDVVQKAKKKPETEEDVDEMADRKVQSGRRLGFLECPFCGEVFETPEDNAEHMTEHGFFIPDVEYLVDLPGLLAYIGDKVGVGHCCVRCNKIFDSLPAVRDHMRATSHCMILCDEDDDGEFDDFFDFSATYTEEAVAALPKVTVSEDGTQLILGDKVLGNRELKVYYEQTFRGGNEIVVSKTRSKLISRYKLIGGGHKKSSKETVQAKKERQLATRRQQRKDLKAGQAKQVVDRKYFVRRDLHF